MALERFLAFGSRAFVPYRTFGRVAFQPVLYFFLWSAAVRITVDDAAVPDIPFRQVLSTWTDVAWDALALGCPPMALLAWRMIARGDGRAKLRGHWLRLSADVGMFVSLLTYHVATVLAEPGWGGDDATAYSRYLTAACIVFIAALVVRDIWSLILIDRVAAGIRDGRLP